MSRCPPGPEGFGLRSRLIQNAVPLTALLMSAHLKVHFGGDLQEIMAVICKAKVSCDSIFAVVELVMVSRR
jgi:hypothetical protein